MKRPYRLISLAILLLISCNKDETSVSSDFSGIVYEYATERPLADIEVSMHAKASPTELNFLGTTTSDNQGKFYFFPEQSDTILAYNYVAEAEGFEIKAPTAFLVGYQNNAPNYDTLIAYEDAYFKFIVNPIGGTDESWFFVNMFSDEFMLSFPFNNRFIFQDSTDVQIGIKKLFKTKNPINVFWSINGKDFEREVELIAQDTVAISINY